MSFDGYEGIPPQLPSLVVSVFDDYDVTPPQLPSTVLSVLDSAGKYLFYPSIFFLRGWLTVPDLTVSTLTTIVKDETTPFQGGLTVPYQTPSWVTVFDSHY